METVSETRKKNKKSLGGPLVKVSFDISIPLRKEEHVST